MVELTGRQRRFLRGLGQRLRPAVHLGKDGLSDATVRHIARLLAKRELQKLRLPASPPPDRKKLAAALSQATGAACVAVVGRTVLLYRPNQQLPLDQRIVLP